MTAELYDLRAKVTAETHCALAAYARAHNEDKSEVVRDILHKWALAQIHGATLLAHCLKAKGITAAPQGASGSGVEPLWEDDQ